jgi:hypothetical protein
MLKWNLIAYVHSLAYCRGRTNLDDHFAQKTSHSRTQMFAVGSNYYSEIECFSHQATVIKLMMFTNPPLVAIATSRHNFIENLIRTWKSHSKMHQWYNMSNKAKIDQMSK